MAISNALQSLIQKTFKKEAKVTRISEDLRGKVIVLYGGNNLGKTHQAARLKNPIFIPCEKGMNAVNGAVVLSTRSWRDMKKHNTTLAKKEYLKLLQSGEQITIVIDGMERAGTYCKKYICSRHDVTSIGKANGGYGAWEEYDTEMWSWVDSIIGLGYTVVFIGHEKLDKKKDKYIIDGDERCIKPIRDNADVVCYLKSNGVDEHNKVIKSSAYIAETDEFFARTRYRYMDTFIPEFTAETLEEVIVDGIKKQNEAEGYESVSFEEQQEIYKTEDEDADIEEVKEDIKELYDRFEEMGDGKIEVYAEIVSDHLGEDVRVSEATNKQLEALLCIRDDLESRIEEFEENDDIEE
ncbi:MULTISPECIES: ATP-binding protein [unclassified Clostridium]|uniref:ATP-binding protein n=1 Tax=unclassified Clostridium TaxID=2614128 RepID=UPI0025BC6230|nr:MULTISPECIES: ATP-binding protein [unclassified Clostridium]